MEKKGWVFGTKYGLPHLDKSNKNGCFGVVLFIIILSSFLFAII